MLVSKPRRIAYFVTVDWYFCLHYLALARAARAAGFEVTVITGVAEHGDAIRSAGLDLIPLEVSRKGMHPWQELKSIIGLVRVLRGLRPDLLHNIAQKPVLYGTLAARLTGVPAVVNGVAGMGWLFTSNAPRARLVRALVGRAYRALLAAPNVRVLVQNPDDQAQVRQLTGVTPVLLPGSGVDVTRFVPRRVRTAYPTTGVDVIRSVPGGEPPEPVVVVLASRMLWDKGVGDFVAAARLLRQRGSTARFVLVGTPDPGNPASVSEDQLIDWQQEGCIEWWGYRADMPEVLAQAHIACLPSYYREGLPKFLIEAAAAGLPLVTTDATGCREAVQAGVNGLLVPPRDPESLADALEQLLVDADRRRRFGVESRALAMERFDAVKIHGETLAVYHELLN
jgi:glycosyltransferase involved in cell wall biosynthesis